MSGMTVSSGPLATEPAGGGIIELFVVISLTSNSGEGRKSSSSPCSYWPGWSVALIRNVTASPAPTRNEGGGGDTPLKAKTVLSKSWGRSATAVVDEPSDGSGTPAGVRALTASMVPIG